MNFKNVIDLLEEVDQNEIINKLKLSSREEQESFIFQINELDKSCRGGLKEYLKRARILLANSEQKNNSFHESKIQVTYDIPHIKVGSEEFYKLEKLGFKELKTSVFVLVV